MTGKKVWKQRSNIQIKGIPEVDSKTKKSKKIKAQICDSNRGIADVPGKSYRESSKWRHLGQVIKC